MQKPFLPALLALALTAAPALADGGSDPQPAAPPCPLHGQPAGLSDSCTALRVAFHTGMNDCLQARQAKAAAGTGAHYAHNAHTNRARMLICDQEVRERMGLSD